LKFVSTQAVAIYDGNCVICNTTRRIVRAFDWLHRVEFLDLHDYEAMAKRYPQVDLMEAMGQVHVVADDGKVYGGFQGMRRMLREVPFGLPLWALLRLPIIGTWLGPEVYRFIARNRYAINRLFGVDLSQEDDCVDGYCKIPQR
jgi:predicted DCC family thiol-disulfide oxidoreductase YuxK